MSLPVLPENAPFDADQRAWLNGYLAGLFSNSVGGGGKIAASRGSLMFLFGSQTGSSETLARTFAKEAGKLGFAARAVGMDEIPDLSGEVRLALVTSTYGEGEMPDNAQGFWDALIDESAARLEHLEYAVLALGDRNYTQFCEAGRKFDARLEELGARRLMPCVECDVDYEADALKWFRSLTVSDSDEAAGGTSKSDDIAEEVGYGKKNPYPALLKTNLVLNGEGAGKETRHLELVLEGSGMEYEIGDALGVMPTNCPDFVQEILTAAGFDGEEAVRTANGSEGSLRNALLQTYDLRTFVDALPSGGKSVEELLAPLRGLQPRLYSISSSPKAHPGEVHLTVAVVRYELDGLARKGVCSTFMADRVLGDARVPVFVHKAPHFKLPSDPAAPVIMVGPGTGIAPFRAFLEERRSLGSNGKNWLFFGDQKKSTDFLYQAQLEEWQNDGFLTRLDVAFSRDQEEKIYVQHRMLEEAAELWAWLENGAYFYVCGDAKRMAKDVDDTLHRVAELAGGLSAEEAIQYFKKMKSGKRYLRDVY